jgi:GMP synthase (glutamine-hydrolysing)
MSRRLNEITDGNVLTFPTGRTGRTSALRTEAFRPVLMILHQETSTPGRVGNALRALGYPLDIRRPRFGDPLPDTLDQHSGAVIFGGPMSANDSEN